VDNYQFVASLVSSLAWPVAVVIVAVVFRSPISEMIGRLEHVKSPLFEGWVKVAEEAHVALATIHPTAATPGKRGSLTEKFSDLAAISPSGAVMTAWIEVEEVLNAKILAAGVAEDKRMYVPRSDVALRAGLISEQTAIAIRKLKDLRNFAAHHRADALDREKALDFLAMADAVVFGIQHVPAKRK
jgi:hypothetical protein